MKPIFIGTSDYKKIIDNGGFYIDKTLLIKEIAETNAEVLLFPRPRRFGKTLNLSMLQYFYERTAQNHLYLFKDMAIWQEEKYRSEQGTWPVISITFKDVKLDSWEAAYTKLIEIISKEFRRHTNILDHESISSLDRQLFQAIIDRSANETEFGSSFLWLCELLFNVYGKKAIVLIDEYDAPIHAAYLNNFYAKMLNFIRPFLSGVLKDNKYLERGVLTGILRVAKESIFSGLNNLKVCSMLEKHEFTTIFGFTQPEVDHALQAYNLTEHRDDIKQWYNGYQSGQATIYNPWSVINCIQKKGELQTYWLNTSDNALIKQEIASCSEEVYSALESLLENQSDEHATEKPENKQVKQLIDVGITMTDLHLEDSTGLERKEHAVWNLLFYAGYVTYSRIPGTEEEYVLRIPNVEVGKLYKSLITESVKRAAPGSAMAELREALQHGDGIAFETKLTDFVMRSMSSHDLYLNQCERNLHMFILGILVLCEKEYAVRSNREAGKGRYDIMLMPKIPGYAGWVIELKKVYPEKKETLESVVDVALNQIKIKKYTEDLRDHGVKNIVAVGVAVHGKTLLAKHEVLYS